MADPTRERRPGGVPVASMRGRDGFVRHTCRWPLCQQLEWDRYPDMHLCQRHAVSVWAIVDADIKAGTLDLTPKPPDRSENRSGTIYYLAIGDWIKIGLAGKLDSRLVSYPPNSELLASHPGTMAEEKRLHSLLTAHRASGREWYHRSPEILAHINGVIAEHGPPISAAIEVASRNKGQPSIRRRSRRQQGRAVR